VREIARPTDWYTRMRTGPIKASIAPAWSNTTFSAQRSDVRRAALELTHMTGEMCSRIGNSISPGSCGRQEIRISFPLYGSGTWSTCLGVESGGEGGIRTLGPGYPGRQISNLVPSTTRPPLRSMKSSTYAVFAFGANSKVSKKCPRFLEPVVRLFASLSTESVSTFLNQCE
jgi:hypothetical protein